eukprot:TRINITY_DN14714_c0_g2_i1.p1 TRINITY_DN14714_c0_g2~~TRINITY_DN14714_c0_g2_i1.p1  ORF type:complete len:334 (+),score=57.91 TRINITY_DN14714_c0_g2_i1:128-1003(+)
MASGTFAVVETSQIADMHRERIDGYTNLWGWGDVWKRVSTWGHHVESVANTTVHKVGSALQKAQDSKFAHRAEASAKRIGRGAVSAVKRGAHEVGEALHKVERSRFMHDVGVEAKRVANATASDAQHVGDALGKGAQWVARGSVHGVKRLADAVQKGEHDLQVQLATALKAQFKNNSYDIQPVCLDVMAVGLVVSAGGAAALAAPEALLGLIGFGAEGVEADSLASLWQSVIGDVPKGSLFSRLQSISAKAVLATQPLKVVGPLAPGAWAFCEVADVICNNCITHRERDSE